MTATAPASATDPFRPSIEELITRITRNHQATCHDAFPELVALARKVERVHHDKPGAPLGLADALDRMLVDLGLHMEEEARVLFPAMLARMNGAIAHPLAMMRSEHEGYAADIARVEELTGGFSVPDGACSSWRRLYDGVSRLCADLREQIRLEDDVLFPRFEIGMQSRCTCAHG